MFTINSPMPPIWIMYPHISEYSIGWRMGYGEGYKYDLYDWIQSLLEEDQKKYHFMFPEPTFWRSSVLLDDTDQDNEMYERWVGDLLIQFWQENGIMKYSKDNDLKQFNLKPIIQIDDNLDYINIKSCLNKKNNSPFTVDTDDYFCLEQYIVAQKALMFNNDDIFNQIIETKNIDKVLVLDQSITNIDRALWSHYYYTICLTGNYYKFSQNIEMRNYLLSTDGQLIIEGYSSNILNNEDFDLRKNLNNYIGENIEGFALMEVRDELMRLYKYFDLIDWRKFKEYQ